MIGKWAMAAAALATLAACGGGNNAKGGGAGEDSVMIQKGTWVYDPNKRHAPVSLSRGDLQGIEIR